MILECLYCVRIRLEGGGGEGEGGEGGGGGKGEREGREGEGEEGGGRERGGGGGKGGEEICLVHVYYRTGNMKIINPHIWSRTFDQYMYLRKCIS